MYLKNYVNKLPVEFEFTWIQILEVISTTECDLFLHLCVVLFYYLASFYSHFQRLFNGYALSELLSPASLSVEGTPVVHIVLLPAC